MSTSSHLNLYAADDTSVKILDLDASLSGTTVSGAAKIHFSNVVSVAATAGDVTDVGARIHTIENAIASGAAGAASASALVQSNLNSVETALNTAIGDLSATVNTNRALSQAEAVHDANQRVVLESNLSIEISNEETARIADVNTLNLTIASEAAARASAISSEASTRSAAVTTLTTDLGIERDRIDAILAGSAVDLNSFLELVTAYEGSDSSILTTIGAIQSQLTSLQNTVDSLVDGS